MDIHAIKLFVENIFHHLLTNFFIFSLDSIEDIQDFQDARAIVRPADRSNDCATERTISTPEPRLQRPLMDRFTQPYMGLYNERLWDKKGIMGRFIGPIEEIYFDFIPDPEMVKALNFNQNRIIT